MVRLRLKPRTVRAISADASEAAHQELWASHQPLHDPERVFDEVARSAIQLGSATARWCMASRASS